MMQTAYSPWGREGPLCVLRPAGRVGEPGTQIALVEGCPWGPAVSAVLLILPEAVRADSVSAEKFMVTERREAFDQSVPTPVHGVEKHLRQVLEASVVTAEGKAAGQDSPYLLLRLKVDPKTGCPFCFDPVAEKAAWCSPYRLDIALTGTLTTARGGVLSALPVDPVPSLAVPCLAGVDLDGVFTGSRGHTLHYASYQPDHPRGEKHPLVIWLHGAGEGGQDPAVVLLGNQVSALFGRKFQEVMGGAYVLAPQSPTYWMQYTEKGDWKKNPGITSVYRTDLTELIKDYVARNPGIDPDRVLVGGCSNGGYMTMDLVMHDPDAFAAAYPICEAYRDQGIPDEALRNMVRSGLPIWFVYAQNDPIVDPERHAAPTIERLAAMGADLHTTVRPNVVDTTGSYRMADGSPQEYNGHFSWVYFFQGACKDDVTGADLWAWMARQNRKNRKKPRP